MDTLTLLPRPAPARAIAAGAWLKNTACRMDGARVLWSEPHGDLGEPGACAALERSLGALRAGGPVDAVAHDLHPDFHSTRAAQALADALGVPAVGVQHHHAHIAAVQAEFGVEEPVIGLALDGVGLGSDGRAWGGELLWVHGAAWRRLGHLSPLALPGGDAAAREPWRVACAVLQRLGREDAIAPRFGAAVPDGQVNALLSMLRRGVNCPPSTSAGRWFDAAAAALGLSLRQHAEAEAAMALEAAARAWLAGHAIDTVDEALVPVTADGVLDLYPLADRLFALAGRPGGAAEGAALFHAALADGLARWAAGAARAEGVRTIALGGGCFLNGVLRGRLEAALRAAGLRVLRPARVHCGDAGLALGQAWVAAHTVAASHDTHARGAAAQEAAACA